MAHAARTGPSPGCSRVLGARVPRHAGPINEASAEENEQGLGLAW